MIHIKPITTNDVAHYEFVEHLLMASFPPEEYRDLSILRQYTDHTKNFRNNIILDNEAPIGLITYWDFDHFCYIEHFAIDPSLRNGGYGKRVLDQLCQLLNRPIILEVEEPNDEMAKRRIQFYQRQGFVLWENRYFQPPYREADHFLPMQLMAHGKLNNELHFEEIKSRIHKEVYHVAE